ncbi:hypothetical protein BY996DRAFT_6414988 [Phakopsora pachyrhizi]|nr:hypothetical protein BY996DRAFT_6414988 [Phakopsora pachyrhizi]
MFLTNCAVPQFAPGSPFENDLAQLKNRVKQADINIRSCFTKIIILLSCSLDPRLRVWDYHSRKTSIDNSICSKTILVKLNEEDSLENGILRYIKWKTFGKSMGYTALLDDCNWIHGPLDDYFEFNPQPCFERFPNRTLIGEVGWETMPHLVAISDSELSSVSLNPSTLPSLKHYEDSPVLSRARYIQFNRRLGFKFLFSRLDSLILNELKIFWKPKTRLRDQIKLLDIYLEKKNHQLRKSRHLKTLFRESNYFEVLRKRKLIVSIHAEPHRLNSTFESSGAISQELNYFLTSENQQVNCRYTDFLVLLLFSDIGNNESQLKKTTSTTMASKFFSCCHSEHSRPPGYFIIEQGEKSGINLFIKIAQK